MATYLNKTYIIRINLSNNILRFEGSNLEEDEFFLSFTDKFGRKLKYNKSTVVAVEEMP